MEVVVNKKTGEQQIRLQFYIPIRKSDSMKELDIVRLKHNFNGLLEGTIGTIVLEYDGTTFEVEFFDDVGNTTDVLTTPTEMLELVSSE